MVSIKTALGLATPGTIPLIPPIYVVPVVYDESVINLISPVAVVWAVAADAFNNMDLVAAVLDTLVDALSNIEFVSVVDAVVPPPDDILAEILIEFAVETPAGAHVAPINTLPNPVVNDAPTVSPIIVLYDPDVNDVQALLPNIVLLLPVKVPTETALYPIIVFDVALVALFIAKTPIPTLFDPVNVPLPTTP